MSHPLTLIVIGGGAAGFFGAITAAQANPDARVILLEKTRQPLAKVRISGGGRCNVTHACFDPAILVQYYPRGNKALRGPFTRFQPRDTIAWFEACDVHLKTESDGRMFPITDSSETIIHCLSNQARKAKVDIRTECGVSAIERVEAGFEIPLNNGERLNCARVLVATGGTPKPFEWLKALGHTIQPLVPSLFTFNVPDSPLKELAGISVPKAHLCIDEIALEQAGPLLITHWGFSGPAVLKLSAWGARMLHDRAYQAKLCVNWLPDYNLQGLRQKLLDYKSAYPTRLVATDSPAEELPRNLWKKMVEMAGIETELRWTILSKHHLDSLLRILQSSIFQISGKTTYKEEFVTCGGVSLDEVNFKTMESRLVPGLYFAGEILDIDGVTGGFNFQNAWTTSWLAGRAMAQ